MKETILNNEKSFKILNRLILSGYYEGSISPQRFVFERNIFPSKNYRIVGVLNNERDLN